MRSAVLLSGRDLSAEIRYETVAQTAWRMTRAAFQYMFLLRGRKPGLVAPLGYPDPGGLFFGYDRYGQLTPEGHWVPGTRQLVATLSVIASARLAAGARVQAESRADSVQRAVAHLDGPLPGILSGLHRFAGPQWSYGLPDGDAGCERLRRWCADIPGIENDFLARSGPHLTGALASRDQRRQAFARACLSRIALDGQTVANLREDTTPG